MKLTENMAPIAEQYDAFIIDLWGVLHDGSHPYPDAIECLTNLRNAGKEIVLLSNAPRRAFKADARMGELGFERSLYDHILTSGELTFLHLLDMRANAEEVAALTSNTGLAIDMEITTARYFYIGPDKDLDLLDDTDYVRVTDAKEASFAVVTGFDEFGDDMETKLPYMREALAAGLPLYCANPDRKVVRQTGEVMLCAGLLAEWYESQGGDVTYFGKPYGRTYDACFELLKTQDRSKVAAIGDGLYTDIKGANGAGIGAIFCTGGIAAAELGLVGDNVGTLPEQAPLEALCEREGAVPDVVIPKFAW